MLHSLRLEHLIVDELGLVPADNVIVTRAVYTVSKATWLVAGTSSIREGSKLERAFRDIYTGTQHAFISEKVAIDAAQIWLGIIEDQPGL